MKQDKRNRLVSFEHRLAMCQLAFGKLSSSSCAKTKVVVSEAELYSWQFATRNM